MNITLSVEHVKGIYELSELMGEGISVSLGVHRYNTRAEALEVAEEIKKVLGMDYEDRSFSDEEGSANWFKFEQVYGKFEITLFYRVPTDSEVLTIAD